MLKALDELGDELEGGGVGLVYYSGHGLEVDGKQYVVPVDAHLASKSRLSHDMIDVNDILAKVGESKSQLNVVILDACRNNPYTKILGAKSLGNGFSPIQIAPSGTIIASATAVGDTASPVGVRNSVYTAHLLQYLREKPNDEIRLLLGDVGTAVKTATGSDQVPWVSGSIDGRFYLGTDKPPEQQIPPMNSITASNSLTSDESQLNKMDIELKNMLNTVGDHELFFSQNCPSQMDFWQKAAEQGQAIAQGYLIKNSNQSNKI